jgi:hypothetical protein
MLVTRCRVSLIEAAIRASQSTRDSLAKQNVSNIRHDSHRKTGQEMMENGQSCTDTLEMTHCHRSTVDH